ncbi:MAG: hypothetical protein ACK5CW_04190 [Verrucomicrobiota bacterium]|jgi:hypothetical protein
MDTLRFEVSLDDLAGFRAAAVLGDSVFEVLVEPRDLRRLRATIMDVARYSGTKKDRRGILILDEPQLSENRLREEWASAQGIFRPEILHRLALVIHREGLPDQVIGQLSWQERDSIPAVIEHERLHSLRPMRRPSEAFLDILRLLLVHWFRQTGPLTSKDLCAQSGFSYPTVAIALEKLEPCMMRHSDRRIELRSFPRDAWFKLVAQAEKVRSSQGYADRSGRPRPPEVLLDRLRELARDDIGVAGVLGARHYLPGLDLMGTPRLDLVVHSKRMRAPNDFLRRLDPALKPVERGESPQVVVHTLYRPETLFTHTDKGDIWADEVECLLDLHEMRLESQALEFVERLTPKPKP